MFTFRLIHEDGTPADPPQFVTAVPNWRVGDTLLARPGRVLRIVAMRSDEGDAVTWVVERMT